MGNGSSWCSNCNCDLTAYLSTHISPAESLSCPTCQKQLRYGKIEPYQFGGSDY